MSRKAFDVVVIGAGPGGSATAAFMADRGYSVALLDRATFPRDKPCAEYLSPEAGRILSRLGVLDSIRTQAQHLSGMTVVSPGGQRFTGRFSGAAPYSGFSESGMALPRAALDVELVHAAVRRGAQLLEGTRFEHFTDSGTHRLVSTRSGVRRTALKARLVVGADGLNSRVAARLGLSQRGRRRRVAFVTHATGIRGMTDVGEMHVGRGAYVGLARVGPDLTNVAVVLDSSKSLPGSSSREIFDAGISGFPEILDRMKGSELVGQLLAAGPFARKTARATATRTILVGDAADFYDPFTGEGIFAALRGAELADEHVADLLERDELSRDSLAVYDRARREHFRGKWLNERAIAFAIDRPALFDRIAKRLALRPQMADLLVGVTGDFVPPSAVLRPSFMLRLVA